MIHKKKKNLVKDEPTLFKEMLNRYNKYANEPRDMQDQGYHTQDSLPEDKDACKYMSEKGGYWRPWKDL